MKTNTSTSKTGPVSLDEFLAKIEKLKNEGGADLSAAEDLSLAVMNLVSLEEHFFFTAMKTGKNDYLDTSREVREMRKELLAKLMPDHEGETWCASKHLLATTMRLIEVGNKFQTDGKKDEALEMFKKAYKIYSIFWALKLKLLNVGEIVKPNAAPGQSAAPTGATENRLEDLVAKLADCCKE